MQPNTDDNPVDTTPRPQEAVAASVGDGMTWLTLATLFARFSTFVSQWIVGLVLSAREFGLYSTAIAISGFLTVCRDAGTGHIIVHRGREAYEDNAGQAFWMGITYNLVILLITILLAGPIAAFYKADELVWLLVILAASLLPNSVASVLYNRLRLDLRFKAVSAIATVSSLARQASLIAFVMSGMGVMSFAWSAMVCCFVDAVCLWWLTRDAVWMRAPRIGRWGQWLGASFWLMFASLANFGMDYAPFLVLGRMLGGDSPIIGYYSFAYQITAQIGVLLAFNSALVLTPVLQRLGADPERQAQATLRALRSLMMVGSVATMGLASIFAPLENLLWSEKFTESVQALVVLGLFYPWRITYGVTASILNAKGEFRRLTWLSVVECVGLFAVSFAAGKVAPTPLGIAVWTGGWVMAIRIVSTLIVFRPMGASTPSILKAMFPAWLLCVVSLGVTLLVSRHLGFDAFAQTLVQQFLPTPAPWDSRLADLIRIILHGTLCGILMFALVRVLLRDHLLDLLAVAPARLRPLLARVLLLRHQPLADDQR